MVHVEIIVAQIDGHEVKIIPTSDDAGKTQYNVQLSDRSFTMVLVEFEYKIVNPASLPQWIIALENRLSDLIFSGK